MYLVAHMNIGQENRLCKSNWEHYLRRMQLYYVERVDKNFGYLSQEESRHLRDVVRKKVGDLIRCTDGIGGDYTGTITRLDKKGGEITIEKSTVSLPAVQVHLAIAPTKNISRTELALEKATEIGIQEVTPLFCNHSERKHLRLERLNKIIRSAAKQSQKVHFPVLNEPMKCTDFIEKYKGKTKKYMAYCGADNLPLLNRIYAPDLYVVIMIGPEGDFSVDEAEAAKAAGYELVSLGDSRLRTETAAIVASSIIQQKHFLA